MNNFRLYDLAIEEKDFLTDKISLVKNDQDPSGNFFSLIIGNNGTGKSRILSSIARYFVNEIKERGQRQFFSNDYNFNRLPSKIIAVTNSISDKFPMDDSFRPSLSSNSTLFYRDFRYNYLGTRNRSNSYSNKSLMYRALDILFENYSEIDISKIYRHVFKYLDYEPILKIEYQISSKLFKYTDGDITPNILLDFLDNQTSNNRYNNSSSSRLNEIAQVKIDEICDLINSQSFRKGEILINFSEKNILRMNNNKLIYNDNVQTYNLLGVLKRLELIRGLQIKVYKKGGSEFDFNEASSGEANVMSTLIALIPLIQDNSLILIDEPEISLHPLWQAQYINLLDNIFSYYSGCHVIIASHSHFLVTDLPPNRSSVISLENRKGRISSNIIEKSTYGWSAEDILLNVFNMPSTRNFYLSQLISSALEKLADNGNARSDLNILKSKLSEFYPLLKDNDPLKKVILLILEENKNE